MLDLLPVGIVGMMLLVCLQSDMIRCNAAIVRHWQL